MNPSTAWLRHHPPEPAVRVIGADVVDESPLSEDQLPAEARAFYATLPVA